MCYLDPMDIFSPLMPPRLENSFIWDLICILARSPGCNGITFERSNFTKIASFKIKLVLL